mmetsp:Transcript_67334/g.186606  ORF Transcript_67334/g.186606 Transcript_67334/m.186606 type:complete len:211 (+) Transcript_67334:183-815(+)
MPAAERLLCPPEEDIPGQGRQVQRGWHRCPCPGGVRRDQRTLRSLHNLILFREGVLVEGRGGQEHDAVPALQSDTRVDPRCRGRGILRPREPRRRGGGCLVVARPSPSARKASQERPPEALGLRLPSPFRLASLQRRQQRPRPPKVRAAAGRRLWRHRWLCRNCRRFRPRCLAPIRAVHPAYVLPGPPCGTGYHHGRTPGVQKCRRSELG